MKSGRKRDPEATRALILDAAEEVFLQKGFGNTALSEIAGRAGVTKSLIHHHFGSKEGLWREVKTRRFVEYVEKQMRMIQEARPTVELIRESLETYFHFLRENPQVTRILAWMFLERDEAVHLELEMGLIQAGVAKVKQAQEAGLLRGDVDARFILFVFIGLAQHWFQDREHFVQEFGVKGIQGKLDNAYLKDITKIFFEGILPRQ